LGGREVKRTAIIGKGSGVAERWKAWGEKEGLPKSWIQGKVLANNVFKTKGRRFLNRKSEGGRGRTKNNERG